MIIITEQCKQMYPGFMMGELRIANADNPEFHEALEEHKKEIQTMLREKYKNYDRPTLKEVPPLDIYGSYFKRFRKTYHVQLQLESVVFKNRPILSVTPLVEAMFMAEVKNLLMTAGHDLDMISGPVEVRAAEGSETFVGIGGNVQNVKPGDIYVCDSMGIISGMLDGPDKRTSISSNTRNMLFTIYAPAGIQEKDIYNHLRDIEDNIRIISPGSETVELAVWK